MECLQLKFATIIIRSCWEHFSIKVRAPEQVTSKQTLSGCWDLGPILLRNSQKYGYNCWWPILKLCTYSNFLPSSEAAGKTIWGNTVCVTLVRNWFTIVHNWFATGSQPVHIQLPTGSQPVHNWFTTGSRPVHNQWFTTGSHWYVTRILGQHICVMGTSHKFTCSEFPT